MSDFNTRMGCERKMERKTERKMKRKEPKGISSSTPLHSGWLKVKWKKQLF